MRTIAIDSDAKEQETDTIAIETCTIENETGAM